MGELEEGGAVTPVIQPSSRLSMVSDHSSSAAPSSTPSVPAGPDYTQDPRYQAVVHGVDSARTVLAAQAQKLAAQEAEYRNSFGVDSVGRSSGNPPPC
jgi:hypothetical protein